MKILFWLPFFLPDMGGIEVFSASLLPELVRRGYQVEVIASFGTNKLPEESTFQGIPVHRLPLRSVLRKENYALLPAVLRRVSEIKRAFQADLYHIHLADPGAFFHLRTIKVQTAPTVVTLQVPSEAFPNLDEGTVIHELAHAADWFTSVSEVTVSGWLEAFPFLSERASLVYNAVELPELTPLPLPFDPPVLLCVGRLVPEKRFDIAIKAMALLRERFPALCLVIVGDGILRNELHELVNNLQLTDRVRFTGVVPHHRISELLNTSTMFLMPSVSEGFPLTPLEAACMARPVVASAIGGIPEVVLDGKTGIIVPPLNPLILADAIGYLLNHPALAQEMGLAGRKLVEVEFSMDRTISGYEEIYHRLVGANARS